MRRRRVLLVASALLLAGWWWWWLIGRSDGYAAPVGPGLLVDYQAVGLNLSGWFVANRQPNVNSPS